MQAHQCNTRKTHCKLEEPATPRADGLVPESEWTIGHELVATRFGPVVGEAIAEQVEEDGTKACIQQVLEDDVLGVLGANGPHRELHCAQGLRVVLEASEQGLVSDRLNFPTQAPCTGMRTTWALHGHVQILLRGAVLAGMQVSSVSHKRLVTCPAVTQPQAA